jgi:hypothetical protein
MHRSRLLVHDKNLPRVGLYNLGENCHRQKKSRQHQENDGQVSAWHWNNYQKMKVRPELNTLHTFPTPICGVGIQNDNLDTTSRTESAALFGNDLQNISSSYSSSLAGYAYSFISLIMSLAFSSSAALRAMFFTFSKVSFDRGPALMHSSLSSTMVVAANKSLSARPDN